MAYKDELAKAKAVRYVKVKAGEYKRACYQEAGRGLYTADYITITNEHLGNSDNYSSDSWYVKVNGNDEAIPYGYATLTEAKRMVELYVEKQYAADLAL